VPKNRRYLGGSSFDLGEVQSLRRLS